MSSRLDGRRVLVVGAGSQAAGDPDAPPSNGQAISVLAAREGANVAAADVNPDAAAETVRRVAETGARGVEIVADVERPEDCERLVDEAAEALGGIDGVVLNVGIGAARGLGLKGTDAETWDHVFAVNLRSHFLVVQRALPLLQPGASIVFVSSLAGLRAGSFLPAYDSSKAGIVGLCRHVALEGARKGIRANVVAPGLIDTPLGRQASQARTKRDSTPIPLGRQGTAWEVAHTVIFLLSDETSYTTAQTLVVDGGLSLI